MPAKFDQFVWCSPQKHIFFPFFEKFERSFIDLFVLLFEIVIVANPQRIDLIADFSNCRFADFFINLEFDLKNHDVEFCVENYYVRRILMFNLLRRIVVCI